MRELERLRATLATIDEAVVAVSGGVDSLTLAHVAHGVLGSRVGMIHAVSPAVPGEATARVRETAAREGWGLRTIDAGEFSDPRYLSNPVDRCFHCKTHLFAAIRHCSAAQILTGANTDDLREYRPGLVAAADFDVRHPYVEAALDKDMVRAVATHLGLATIATLPASPCLSSRVETSIPIEVSTLLAIDAAEKLLRAQTHAATVRCRIRASGVVVEMEGDSLAALPEARRDTIRASVGPLFRVPPESIRFEAYRNGSAFLVLRRA